MRIVIAFLLSALAAAQTPSGGVIVADVQPNSQAASLGIVKGTRISAVGGTAAGSPGMFAALMQNAPYGKPIVLTVHLSGSKKDVQAKPPTLGAFLIPDLNQKSLEAWTQVQTAISVKNTDEAIRQLTIAISTADTGKAWLNLQLGDMLANLKKQDEAMAAYAAARAAGDSAEKILSLRGAARIETARESVKAAQDSYRQARELGLAAGFELWPAQDSYSIAFLAMGLQDYDTADRRYKEALVGFQHQAPGSPQEAAVLNDLGVLNERRERWDLATDYHKQALAIREAIKADSPDCGFSHRNLALIALKRDNLSDAKDGFQRALDIFVKLQPEALVVADCYDGLGWVAERVPDPKLASTHFQRSLAIREKLRPDGLEVAESFGNLARTTRADQDFPKAKEYGQKSLVIREKLVPDSLLVASSLNTLGNIAADQGHFGEADDLHRRALAIRRAKSPGSYPEAESLNNLGNVAVDRADFIAAEELFRQVKDILDKTRAGTLAQAGCLVNLASALYEQERLDEAEPFLKAALEIYEDKARSSPDKVKVLNMQGLLAQDKARLLKEASSNPDETKISDLLKDAQRALTAALDLVRAVAPGSMTEAMILVNLGTVARDKDDHAGAMKRYATAEPILAKLGPRTLAMAQLLSNRGHSELATDKTDAAVASFTTSLSIFEEQRSTLGSTDARALMVGTHTRKYAGLLQARIKQGNNNAAFDVAERSRARSLVDLLSEQALDVMSDLPIDLKERQIELAAKQRQLYKDLVWLSPKEQDTRGATLLVSVGNLQIEQRTLEDEIKRRSPKWKAFRYPEPLDLAGVQKVLDPGTLLLTFAVDDKATTIFAVTKNTVEARTVPIRDTDLRAKVVELNDLLARNQPSTKQSVEMYALLLKPVQGSVTKAERVLICPDGPLSVLPFAALVVNSDAPPDYDPAKVEQDEQRGVGSAIKAPNIIYFSDLKPMHVVPSMTVYAQLRTRAAERVEEPKKAIVAYGHPTAPAAQPVKKAGPGTRDFPTEPLPGMLKEVQNISDQYTIQALVRSDDDATETHFRTDCGLGRIVHFACHGFLVDADPMASGLVLSKSTEDDGFLQAWEVFKLKLNADLVVLSACQTGLGLEMQREGIMGLTRAFQYAGARSVVVSLWSVQDESTTALMETFYSELKGGTVSKDEALAKAMSTVRNMATWKGKKVNWRSPYHWAAFALVGDWE